MKDKRQKGYDRRGQEMAIEVNRDNEKLIEIAIT